MPMLVGTQKVGRYLNTKLSRNEEISRVEQQNELLLCRRGARTMQVTKPLKHYILHCYCHSNAPNYRKKTSDFCKFNHISNVGFYFGSWKTRWAIELEYFSSFQLDFPSPSLPLHTHSSEWGFYNWLVHLILSKSPPCCWLPGAALELHIFHSRVQGSVYCSHRLSLLAAASVMGMRGFIWDFPCRETHSDQPKLTQERLLWLLLTQLQLTGVVMWVSGGALSRRERNKIRQLRWE